MSQLALDAADKLYPSPISAVEVAAACALVVLTEPQLAATLPAREFIGLVRATLEAKYTLDRTETPAVNVDLSSFTLPGGDR